MAAEAALGPVKPQWWRGDVDASVLSSMFGFVVTTARTEAMDHFGGAFASLFRLIVETPEGTRLFVIKYLPEDGLEKSLFLGLTREVDFFMWLKGTDYKTRNASDVVGCPYAVGVPATGEKLCVLDDLGGSKEGRYLMLRQHPLCAKDDIEALTTGCPSQLEWCTMVFELIARFHAAFWGKLDFSTLPWVHGSGWLQGKDRDLWDKEQGMSKGMWATCKQAIAEGMSKIQWDDNVIALLDASFEKIDWESMRARLVEEALTLAHGDFWPCNLLFHEGRPVLIDWEFVKVGSGRQDLAQFMVNMDVAFRREHERMLLQAYVDEFNRQGDPQITMEETLRGYAYGGAAKLCWLLPVMANIGHDQDKWGQFFNDQAQAWFADFKYTAENIPAPRQ